MDKKDWNANYEAPHVEIIEVEIEQGFATSYTSGGIDDLEEEPWS